MKTTTIGLLAALLILVPALGETAKIYKWKDGQGRVTYSDSPSPGAEVMEIPTEPAGIVRAAPEQARALQQPAAPFTYGALILASPSDGEILDNPESVNVSLALEPPLRVSQGDAIRLTLDGEALDTRYTGGQMALAEVTRGTHTLLAEVVNPAGNVLIASAPVTFHVHEPSSQAPAGPDIYEPAYPGQPYPQIYRPVYPPQPYQPQGRPKPAPAPR